MVAKTAPRKPYNTVTARAMRRHAETNIYTHGAAVDALAAPLSARIQDLKSMHSDRFTKSTLAAELLAGKTFDPEHYSEMIRNSHLEQSLMEAEMQLLTDALFELRQRRNDWEPRELGDQELTYLAEQMSALVDDVKRIAADHPETITLDQVQRRPELSDGLNAQYLACEAWEHIRARQLRIATHADVRGVEQRRALAITGRLRDAVNAEEVWLDARRRNTDAALEYQRTAIPRLKMSEERLAFFLDVPARRWPESTEPTSAWPDGVDVWEYLAWAAEHAEPWVPTLDQLLEQHDVNLAAVEVGPRNLTELQSAGRTNRSGR